GHAGGDSRRGRERDSADGPRRPAAPDPRADGALSGVLLRRARSRPARRAERARRGRDHGAARVNEASAVAGETADVAVVGAGPAGLAAAVQLRRAGAGRVVVLDREAEPGGIPRHAKHQGFGIRDLHRVMSGPRYAARIAEAAIDAGAELRTEAQVTGWAGGALEVTAPRGRSRLDARAVVLATGCRERPRPARLVPGSRPQGVMTTSMLQQLVYLRGESPGRRAVVVGAEHVSFSALLTLSHGG